jgi:hypothetical protein
LHAAVSLQPRAAVFQEAGPEAFCASLGPKFLAPGLQRVRRAPVPSSAATRVVDQQKCLPTRPKCLITDRPAQPVELSVCRLIWCTCAIRERQAETVVYLPQRVSPLPQRPRAGAFYQFATPSAKRQFGTLGPFASSHMLHMRTGTKRRFWHFSTSLDVANPVANGVQSGHRISVRNRSFVTRTDVTDGTLLPCTMPHL